MPETLRPVCIAGGGPVEICWASYVSQGSVSVLVLEKHADCLRDFRGDTLHPSTLEVMHELGVLERFLHSPHQTVPSDQRPDRRSRVHGSGFLSSADPMPLRRLHAAVGLSELSRGRRRPVSRISGPHECRGHGCERARWCSDRASC